MAIVKAKPRKGYRFIYMDLTDYQGNFISQFWYEASNLFKPDWGQLAKAIKEHYPSIRNFLVEPTKFPINDPNQVRIHRAPNC